jgi:multiple sugar transport system permease protein
MGDSDHITDDALEPEGATATRERRVEAPDVAPEPDLGLGERLREALPTPGRAGRYAIAIFLAVVWIVPFVGLLMASFRPLSEILDGWWHLEGMTITFENYYAALEFSTAPMAQAMINTAIVTIPSVLVVTLLGAMAAYPFARFDFPLKRTLFSSSSW